MSQTEKLLIGLEEIAEDNNTIVQHINFRGRTITMEYSTVHEQDGETYIYLRVGMSGRKEVKYFAHETGHIYKGICRIQTLPNIARLLEERAWDWAATYLVPYREYKKMMRDPHINSDYDMAEALEVDIEILQRAVRVYKRQGLDIRRSEE